MKHEIEIPDLPEGWEAVAYRKPKVGEYYLTPDWITVEALHDYKLSHLIVSKKQPRRDLYDPLRFAEGLIEQLPDDHEGAINWLMNNGDGEKADNLRKKYSHPQPRRIVLEETDIDNYEIVYRKNQGASTYWKIVEDNKCAE